MDEPTRDAKRVVERVARTSYARLISFLAARSGDVAGAEDALSEAFLAAVRTWPIHGVPHNPEAWLLQAARRRFIDHLRLARTRDAHADAHADADVLRSSIVEAEGMAATHTFPDERLKLLFVCAHPAIDPRVHTPLMLQTVLGLDAAAIAAAFLVPPATMGQRLSRAKAKIKKTRISFDVPAPSDLSPRLLAVLEAIYAAYGHGWHDIDGAEPGTRTAADAHSHASRPALTDEAIYLCRTLLELLPDEPEALGLLALMLYCEARRPARRTADGRYVPSPNKTSAAGTAPSCTKPNAPSPSRHDTAAPVASNSKPPSNPLISNASPAAASTGSTSPSFTKAYSASPPPSAPASATPPQSLMHEAPPKASLSSTPFRNETSPPINPTGPRAPTSSAHSAATPTPKPPITAPPPSPTTPPSATFYVDVPPRRREPLFRAASRQPACASAGA